MSGEVKGAVTADADGSVAWIDAARRFVPLGGGRHWHGGPDPCKVCGGLSPNPAPHVELEDGEP